MPRIVASFLTAALLAAVAPAAAQGHADSAPAEPVPQKLGWASAQPPLGFRVFFLAELDRMAAAKSFKAVLGSSSLTEFGLGADITSVWKDMFIRAAFSRKAKTGTRVFVSNGAVFPLNIPLTVRMTPLELGGGWRFVSRPSTWWTPYLGGGLLTMKYQETSQFAQPGEDVSQWVRGVTIFGGVDFDVAKFTTAGVEAQYRRIPKALGVGGVSADFGETDLGGLTVRVLFGVKK